MIRTLIAAVILTGSFAASLPAQAPAAAGEFQVRFDKFGIASLKRVNDKYNTEYIAPGRTLGHIRASYKLGGTEVRQFTTADPKNKVRTSGNAQDQTVSYNVSGWNDFFADVELTERFRVEKDYVYWSIHLRNPTNQPLEIGDLFLPLPFNMEKRWDKKISYTERLVQHTFVSGNGSFAYWMRPNSEGPFLVMVPVTECPPFESTNAERDFTPAKFEYSQGGGVYIHAKYIVDAGIKQGGNWRQPHTSVTRSPRFSRNGRITYAFKFRWAQNHDAVRDILYEEGLFDVNVAPGMTVPQGLDALVSLRSKSAIHSIVPEFPEQTKIAESDAKTKDTRVYKVTFSRLGENKLTVNFGRNQYMVLEFFVTEPLETVIKKRAAFLVARHQHRDPAKWYNGLFSEWDQRSKVLRSPEDTGGLLDYIVASDDPGLSKAPYIASKNAEYPDAKEIEAVEYYLKNYVWGKLQQTEKEEHPYAIYGIDNWKVNREAKPGDRNGWTGHVWRPFDYPHVINLYWSMYRVAKYYPGMVKYLDKNGYLERAFGTAKAYYTAPLKYASWSPFEVGHYDELIIPELISELYAAGWKDKADYLRSQWEHKVEHFVNDRPNLFLSEYPFDPTGFESHHAFARYASEQVKQPGATLKVKPADVADFMQEEISGNIATRGWLETAYYQLGSEGALRYMSQMAGWSVLDYGLYYAKDPYPYLRLGYASILSSWALMNTGTPESNYGYWYPGKENDGAAGSAFINSAYGRSWIGIAQPRGPWPYSAEIDLGFGGGLRGAATVVADDPIFGLIAYGAKLSRSGNHLEVVPVDGLRRRFHVVRGADRLHVVLERDGFASGRPIRFDQALNEVSFVIENRAGEAHAAAMTVPASWTVTVEGKPIARTGETVSIPVAGAEVRVALRRQK